MKKKEMKLKIKDLEIQIETLKWMLTKEKQERLKWHGKFFDLMEDLENKGSKYVAECACGYPMDSGGCSRGC